MKNSNKFTLEEIKQMHAAGKEVYLFQIYFPTRLESALYSQNVRTVRDLIKFSETRKFKRSMIKGIGEKGEREIIKLTKHLNNEPYEVHEGLENDLPILPDDTLFTVQELKIIKEALINQLPYGKVAEICECKLYRVGKVVSKWNRIIG